MFAATALLVNVYELAKCWTVELITALPLIAAFDENVATPVTDTVLENVAFPVTAMVLENVALPVTAIVLLNVALPTTVMVLLNVALPVNVERFDTDMFAVATLVVTNMFSKWPWRQTAVVLPMSKVLLLEGMKLPLEVDVVA